MLSESYIIVRYAADGHAGEEGDGKVYGPFRTLAAARDRVAQLLDPTGWASEWSIHDARWWQPPADVKADPDATERLYSRIKDYFAEGWGYVGLVLEMVGQPCPCCGETKTDVVSVWAVESDLSDDDFEGMVSDLLAEAD